VNPALSITSKRGLNLQIGSKSSTPSGPFFSDGNTYRLPKAHRDHLQAVYNAHMLHPLTADPFKLALYKLMGKLEPSRRSVPQVTTTTEDWLWFQMAMVS
jgi:Nup93/Nic96